MIYIFNNLSLKYGNAHDLIKSKPEAIIAMSNFVHTCAEAEKIGFKELRLSTGSLKEYHLFEHYTVGTWLKDKQVDRNDKSRLRSLIVNSPVILPNEIEINAKFQIRDFYIDFDSTEDVSALGASCLFFETGTLTVSFLSHEIWRKSRIQLTQFLEDDSLNGITESQVEVLHASLPEHIEQNRNELENIVRINTDFTGWVPAKDFFPKLESPKREEEKWKKFIAKRDSLSDRDRMAFIEFEGTEVAERNGYQLDSFTTKINRSKDSKRKVFSFGLQKGKIYLSIDFETGGFEVCDYKGEHLGEYRFSGIKEKGADSSHDIEIKKG
jgi:hypothetical protein